MDIVPVYIAAVIGGYALMLSGALSGMFRLASEVINFLIPNRCEDCGAKFHSRSDDMPLCIDCKRDAFI